MSDPALFLSRKNKMDERELVKGFDLTPAFIAGVSSVAYSRGMPEKDTEAFVDGICKAAASGMSPFEDYGDDTFWSRNKNWMIPTLVCALAYWIGADGNRADNPGFRADSNSIENSVRVMGKRLGRLFGLNKTPLEKAFTETK
jgi:hypothetical protein